MTTIYFGPVINPQSLTSFLALPRCLIAVGHDGNILWIDNDVDPADLSDTLVHHALQNYTLVELKPGEFIMPGLVDTHIVRKSPSSAVHCSHLCSMPVSFQTLECAHSLSLTWNVPVTLPCQWRRSSTSRLARHVYLSRRS